MAETPPKKQHFARKLLLVAVLGGIAAAVIWSFVEGRAELAREAERERPVKPPQRVSLERSEVVITLDPASQKESGLHTATLQQTTYHEQLRAYGTILDLQPLVDLDNSYALASAQLNAAQAKLDASRAEFEREDKLFKTQTSIVTLDKLQAAESAFHTDEAVAASADAQLRTVQETALQTWGPVLGRQLGEANQTFARLVQREDYLVQVTLQPGALVSNPPATATILLENGQRKDIHFISPATRTNASIQGISLLYSTPASSDLLPGMNVLVLLPLDSTIKGVAIPENAIVWWQGRPWVYVRTGPSTFIRRAVAVDDPLPEGGYLDRSLRSGTEIVVEGAQMLLSEEFRAEVHVGEEGPGQ